MGGGTRETFETLEKCVYERKDLGLSREQDEMMICDCVYDRGKSCQGSLLHDRLSPFEVGYGW